MTLRSITRSWTSLSVVVLLTGALAGCDHNPGTLHMFEGGGEVAGVEAKPGSHLAYEHTVNFTVDAADIAGRVEGIRAACEDARFGECELLRVQVTAGEHASGDITVRVVPAGVEKLVGLGGSPGEIANRETSAEDLSQPIAETGERLQQTTIQRDQLVEFSKRKDLKASDLIALAQQIAALESELRNLRQDSANQQRRISTNWLRMRFDTEIQDVRSTSWSSLGPAFVKNLREGLRSAVEYAGYLLPSIVLMFPLALLLRALWRWSTRKSRAAATGASP